MAKYFLIFLIHLFLAHTTSIFAQADTSQPANLYGNEATAKVYFYINESEAVVKLNDTIIKVNTKKPMMLMYGTYRIEAWAWGHEHYRDTLEIEEPTELVRITMQRTTEFEAYHSDRRKFYLQKTLTAIPLPAMLIIGGIQYVQYNNEVSNYEDQLTQSTEQALYYKEQYEQALTVENVEDNKRKFETWKAAHEETVNRYNDYLRKTRIKAGVMTGLTVIAGYVFYKFFTLEKPSFSDQSPFKHVSLQSFKSQYHDTGLTITYNF